MRLLLDESLPRRLGRLITGHEVVTVAEAGWSGLTNGRLLAVAQHEFDCLLTVDRSLVFQQSLPQFDIAVLVLRARTNRVDDLAPLVPRVLEVLPAMEPGRFIVVEQPFPAAYLQENRDGAARRTRQGAMALR